MPAGRRATPETPPGAWWGIRGANRSYYLFDGLGSVVAVTNANGGVTNAYTYDPYGVTTETKATLTNVFNPWRYAGQYQDTTTGLYKMGARYYQPELGRWTQQDPSGQDANAYAYVGGNPVNFVDPTGNCAREVVNYALTATGTTIAAGAVLAGTGGVGAFGVLALGVGATFLAGLDLIEC